MATILVVEDNAPQLRVLAIWLQRHGHTVLEAAGGQQAQATLNELAAPGDDQQPAGALPDLIVSDVNMPGMNGVELIKWIRNERKLEMPILVLSSRCDQVGLREELRAPGIRVVPKPFSPSRLIVEIDRLLGGVVC
jgi:twitching motility two-component system response regulator PilH